MTDTALIPARNAFQDAISALIDPQVQFLHGRRVYLDSRYDQLNDSLAGQQGRGDHRARSSLTLLWLDAYILLEQIDNAVAYWHPEAPHSRQCRWRDKPQPALTVSRLELLSDGRYRPQDVPELTDRTSRLQGWADKIDALLLPEISVVLRGETCPICGHDTYQRPDPTEPQNTITDPALIVGGDGALCRACRAVWEFQKLPLLGRMLGVRPAAEILGS